MFDEAIIAVLMVVVAIGLDYICQAILVGGMRRYTKRFPHTWNTLLMKRKVFHHLIHTDSGCSYFLSVAVGLYPRKGITFSFSESLCTIHCLFAFIGCQRRFVDDSRCVQ